MQEKNLSLGRDIFMSSFEDWDTVCPVHNHEHTNTHAFAYFYIPHQIRLQNPRNDVNSKSFDRYFNGINS